jgi:CPA1 family monovalent cation:H+ antiporter
MSVFDLAALLVGLAALFGYVNHRTMRLPDTIGLLFLSIVVSLGIILLDRVIRVWRCGPR